MGKGVKAFVYMRMLPSVIALVMNLGSTCTYAKVRRRRARRHFLSGLEQAGLDPDSARKIAEVCYNGHKKGREKA